MITFLEKKSTRKIHKYETVGRTWDILIDVDANDRPRFEHLDGFTFSGAPITVEEARNQPSQHNNNQNQRTPFGQGNQNQNLSRNENNPPSGPRSQRNAADLFPGFQRNDPFQQNNKSVFGQSNNQSNPFGSQKNNQNQDQNQKSNQSTPQADARNLIAGIIRKRYQADNHFLTMEALAKDPDVQNSELMGSSAAKVWKSFFVICEQDVFETPAKRREMVHSVSVGNNELKDVWDVVALSSCFPELKNLDLSNNKIENAGDLRFWKNSLLRNLEHIVLIGNPIMDKPDELKKLRHWCGRNLKAINGESVIPEGMSLDFRTDSPAPQIREHPEVDVRTFGQPVPGKSDEQLNKEKMGLEFSFESGLKLQYVEMALESSNFDYQKAGQNFLEAKANNQIPADWYIQVPQ